MLASATSEEEEGGGEGEGRRRKVFPAPSTSGAAMGKTPRFSAPCQERLSHSPAPPRPSRARGPRAGRTLNPAAPGRRAGAGLLCAAQHRPPHSLRREGDHGVSVLASFASFLLTLLKEPSSDCSFTEVYDLQVGDLT